jgi:hypothetical protein
MGKGEKRWFQGAVRGVITGMELPYRCVIEDNASHARTMVRKKQPEKHLEHSPLTC